MKQSFSDSVRSRAFALGIPPTTVLSRLFGMWPCYMSEFLTGKRHFGPELSLKLENTLLACERLAAASPAPIKWTEIGKVGPLVLKYRKTIEAEQFKKEVAAERREIYAEHEFTRELTTPD